MVINFGNDIEVGPLVVLTALSGGKLSKLILKFNFLLISRALARFDAETFQRRVNCYIVTLILGLEAHCLNALLFALMRFFERISTTRLFF